MKNNYSPINCKVVTNIGEENDYFINYVTLLIFVSNYGGFE